MIETVLSMKLNIRNLKNIPGRLFNRKVKQSCECAVPEYDEIYIVEQPGGPVQDARIIDVECSDLSDSDDVKSDVIEINNLIEEMSGVELKKGCALKDFAGRFGEKAGEAIGFFSNRANDFKEKYTTDGFISTIGKYARKAGTSAVYSALLLFYALQNGKVPLKKRALAIAALGYFIAPLDFIPDIILGGLVDDVAVIMYAVNTLKDCIDDETKALAKSRLNKWFGDVEISDMKVPATLLPSTK